jgi:murein DD-endopeptidase MepM/ murein hydrolase activator NlpD
MKRLSWLLALWVGITLADSPYPFKVQSERQGSAATVHARNGGPVPITVRMELAERDNVSTAERWPLIVVVPPHADVAVARITAFDPKRSWRYRNRYRFQFGAYTAKHDPAALYRLPWPDGRAFVIGQAPGGPVVTHKSPASRNAVDISMPEGTPVVAARAGLVFFTVSENDQGGFDEAYRSKANVVRILHDDGTVGNYVHLRHDGVAVKEGERVEAGKVIGYSGSTGLSAGPHLHFAVTRVAREGDELTVVSEPFRFYVGDPPRPFTPQYGLAVRADYSAAAAAPRLVRRPPASAPAPSAR